MAALPSPPSFDRCDWNMSVSPEKESWCAISLLVWGSPTQRAHWPSNFLDSECGELLGPAPANGAPQCVASLFQGAGLVWIRTSLCRRSSSPKVLGRVGLLTRGTLQSFRLLKTMAPASRNQWPLFLLPLCPCQPQIPKLTLNSFSENGPFCSLSIAEVGALILCLQSLAGCWEAIGYPQKMTVAPLFLTTLEVYRRVDNTTNSNPWSLPTTEKVWHAHAEGVLMVALTSLNLPPEACEVQAYRMLSPALGFEEVGLMTYLQTPLMQTHLCCRRLLVCRTGGAQEDAWFRLAEDCLRQTNCMNPLLRY